MELTYARCEQILDTLPIGYYTGRRVGVTLDEKADTSFYSTTEDSIVISYPIIAQRMKGMPEGSNEESAVRSMLYHEVSHAILTPSDLESNFAVNCFEDERIESVLRHYYHNTDFRQQLYDLCGGHAPKAVDKQSAFFNAVRFGLGTPEVQREITRMLNKYAEINRGTRRTWDYTSDIENLYNLVSCEFRDHPEEFQDKDGQGEQQQMDKLQTQNQQSGQGQEQGQQKQQQSGGNDEQNENQSESSDGEGSGDDQQEGQDDSPQNQSSPSEGAGYSEKSENRPKNPMDERIKKKMSIDDMKELISEKLSKYPTMNGEQCNRLDEFQKTVEMIIGNFNKKNSGGSGINAYSGVFNPRAVVRKDYRYFERSMSIQGNNRFGTCHLNLIIDCSGSFEWNVPLTNGILAVLSEVERKNRNFSLDVAFINHTFHQCTSVRERNMEAWGSNAVPANMKQIMLSNQKPQTCNYNIVLFDGDAMCDNSFSNLRGYQERFSAFDMKQTTLITNCSNEKYCKNFTSTKVIVTNNYTDELIKHITNALTIAFG